MASLVQPSWKDAAIERSVVITDAWEVTKIYCGRAAEWVLFVCMVLNIVEMLPGVTFWPWLANVIMATQVVTLDVAGFGLASMAEYAREIGQEDAAKQASITARCLIGIMIITLVSVTASVLFPPIRQYVGYAEDVLILIRVAMVVIYGHVIHRLRRVTGVKMAPAGQSEEIARLQQMLNDLQIQSQKAVQEWRDKIAVLEGQIVTLEESKNAPQIAPESDTPSLLDEHNDDLLEDTQDAPESDTQSAPLLTLVRAQECSSVHTKSRTGNSSEKAAKAKRYIQRNAGISAPELARKAEISVSYARKLLAKKEA